jgi:hypothetical protein
MAESTPEYEVIEGNWAVCKLCWATVHFNYLAHHTRWHQEPEIKDVENPPE